MNKDSWPLQSEWLDACVIRELVVVCLIYLPQVVESHRVPGGDLNTATISKIQNLTTSLQQRDLELWWCALSGDGEQECLES